MDTQTVAGVTFRIATAEENRAREIRQIRDDLAEARGQLRRARSAKGRAEAQSAVNLYIRMLHNRGE
jgi:hypothetical protein